MQLLNTPYKRYILTDFFSFLPEWTIKEIKMNQKVINWKIIGVQDVLATKIQSPQLPSLVIHWLCHEMEKT